MLPKRSFDPALNAPSRPISALKVADEKAAARAGGTSVTSAVVRGRESLVVEDIRKMADSEARSLAMVQLMSQWAKEDIETAMAFGDTIENDLALRRAFDQGVAPYLSEHQPGRLLDIISNGNWWPDQWLPERAAIQRLAREDFERASQFFADTSPNKQHLEEAYRFTRQIARTDSTEAALAYIDSLENPRAKGGATRAAVAHWMNEDSLAASQHVQELTDPVVRDHGVLGLVDGLWQTNPDDSVTWAESIADADLRSGTYVRLANAWQGIGQEENVQSLLQNPALTSAEKEAIQSALAETSSDG